jgi:hypothetical protein
VQLALIGVFLIVLSVMIFTLSSIATSAGSTYGVFTSDSMPFGRPYSHWVQDWWIWWDGIPNDKHPAKDYSDSERCSVMQDGPVWFLPDVLPAAGNLDYRCNIPVGKAILLPITTSNCDKGFNPDMTDSQLSECADNILTPISNMNITVDGKRIDVNKLLAKTDFFNVTYPDPPVDIWGPVPAGPGTYKGIATGYFLFLHDLSPGKHKIDLHVIDLLKGNEGPPPRFDPPREFGFEVFVQ